VVAGGHRTNARAEREHRANRRDARDAPEAALVAIGGSPKFVLGPHRSPSSIRARLVAPSRLRQFNDDPRAAKSTARRTSRCAGRHAGVDRSTVAAGSSEDGVIDKSLEGDAMTTTDAPAAPERSADALVGRLFEATIGMMEVMSVYVGDRLGLYRALRDGGPATTAELAERAGIDERYAREWLEQQAVADILEVDDAAAPAEKRRYALPEAYASPLLDLESPMSIAPLARSVVASAKVLPQLLDAYRTGGGVEWADFGPDMLEAQGDFNRPWLRGSFGSEILPAIPAIHERLTANPSARVADVACGVGWASIAIAAAYPGVRVDGFDLDPSSIDLARANAAAAGVADRVTFAVRDAADPAAAGQYDVAVVVEAIHDLTQPVEVLAAIRQMLRPGGVALIADERTDDAFSAPGSDVERIFYGFSLFTCLPAAMTERPTAATGTVIRADTMRRYAEAAGFTGFARLDEPALDMLRFYLLTP
jgi:2-polyprenyl-3-methyl-5-hydroxy-6-metoxy-1,4-benzoquinol methylase